MQFCLSRFAIAFALLALIPLGFGLPAQGNGSKSACDILCPFLLKNPSIDPQSLDAISLVNVVCKPEDVECRKSLQNNVKKPQTSTDSIDSYSCQCSSLKSVSPSPEDGQPENRPSTSHESDTKEDLELRSLRARDISKDPMKLGAIILGSLVGSIIIVCVILGLARRKGKQFGSESESKG